MHSNIIASVNPDSVMDQLFSKKIVRCDDYLRLRHVPVSTDRCHEMLSLLYVSPHPEAFIHLRLALLDEYSWIVDEIDKQAHWLQQLHLDRSTDGKRSLQINVYRIHYLLKLLCATDMPICVFV